MLLPNNERAIAESGKVRDYLLSVDHPRGCYKSVFFRAIGYSQARWQKLRGDLADIARTTVAVKQADTPFGARYAVVGILRSASGKAYRVRTVWLIVHVGASPRLLTAFPK